MKTLIEILLIMTSICIVSCQNSHNNLTVTDVQFMDYINNPIIQEGHWINHNHYSLNSMNKELEEYKLRLLGKKVYIEYFDNTIKIRIETDKQTREFLLEKNKNGNYSNSTIDANVENKLFNKRITLKLNAHQELKYVKTLFSTDSIIQADYYAAKETAEILGQSFDANDIDYKIDERCYFDKGIIVTIKDK